MGVRGRCGKINQVRKSHVNTLWYKILAREKEKEKGGIEKKIGQAFFRAWDVIFSSRCFGMNTMSSRDTGIGKGNIIKHFKVKVLVFYNLARNQRWVN